MVKLRYFNKKNKFFHGIMFHHFHDTSNHIKSQGSITARQFEKILKLLNKKNIIKPSDLYKLKNKELPNNKVCITFDDCLKSQYDIALPILKKYKIKAFFFIYSNAIFGKINFHEIFRYFRQKYYKNFSKFYKEFYNEVKINYSQKKIEKFIQQNNKKINIWKKRFSFYSEEDIKFRFLRDRFLSQQDYKNIIIKFFKKKKFDYKNLPKKIIMSKKELRNLKYLGHEIGLHSHSHPTLLEKLPKYKQYLEYKENKKYLDSMGIRNIKSMSHPNGSYNTKTLKILKDLKIDIGFRQIMSDGQKKINNTNLEISRIDHSEIVRKYKI